LDISNIVVITQHLVGYGARFDSAWEGLLHGVMVKIGKLGDWIAYVSKMVKSIRTSFMKRRH
jgi:hypothetical protein